MKTVLNKFMYDLTEKELSLFINDWQSFDPVYAERVKKSVLKRYPELA